MGERVEVKFNQDYVASRGAGISGRKGDTKMYPDSPDLRKLIDNDPVTKVKVHKPKKKTAAATREKAAGKKQGAETS